MRIVVDGPSLSVYGPGARVNHSQFEAELDATLHQTAVEQSLVHQGWTLETLTTERRSAPRPAAATGRGDLRLVPEPDRSSEE